MKISSWVSSHCTWRSLLSKSCGSIQNLFPKKVWKSTSKKKCVGAFLRQIQLAGLKVIAKKCVFQSQNFYKKKTGCKSSATRKNDFFRKKVRVRLYFAYWFRTRLHTSIFRSRFPNYFLGINFGLSHTSCKRINTVDLSLAHINYGLKIFMRETKFVLIYIFSILRSFNGYSCHHVKIPVKPTNCRHTV